jgi:hypothetical protein
VKAVLGMGPNIANIEDCLPMVTERVKSLFRQTQELRQIPVDRQEIEALKRERDANKMEALETRRGLVDERLRSEAFKKRVEDLESSEEIQKIRRSMEKLETDHRRLIESMSEMRQQYNVSEYELRDVRRERDEIKERYRQLQLVDANRAWATTDRNCYNEFLVLRDAIVPECPLGGAREAILRKWNALVAGTELSERKAQGMQDELQTAKAEWAHERSAKNEVYELYAELRRIFCLDGISATDAKRTHAAIRHMLAKRGEEIKELSERLEKERALACAEIRRLEDLIKTKGGV